MMKYIISGFLILFMALCIKCGGFMKGCGAFVRLFFHIPTICKDIYKYFRYKEYKTFKDTGIIMLGGLFGTGKSLNMVDYATKIYKRYDNVEIYSNITLKDIPYVKFEYFEQLCDPVEKGSIRVYICDEFGSLFNSRNYKTNKITENQYLITLNQLRKENKLLLITTQRYGMVDKVFRQVCKEWLECKKWWRFYFYDTYDPYDLEYSADPRLIRPIRFFPHVLFATDKVYARYDTHEIVQGFDNPIEITNRADTLEYSDYANGRNLKKKFARK